MLTKENINELKQFGAFKLFKGNPSKQEYVDRVRDADVLLLWNGISNEVMAECPSLKLMSFTGTGYKNYMDVDFAAKHGIKVANTPSYGANPVAEHALALLFSLAKNIPQNHANMLKGKWDPSSINIELEGKTMGLIGLGSIGTRMAKLCRALGMNVICWTFHPSEERAQQLGITFVSLESLLSSSDFISLHLPYTDTTKEFIGEKQFSMIKPGAIFINTARSEVVHTPSLIKSLSSGILVGAGIDVFDQEPISKDNPLLQCNNVILSPHVGFNTKESVQTILGIAIRNIVEFIKGNPLNIVN
ncbi:MAG: NAD(P)-dependent oxidoreductase [Paenibacillaceae bacterium]